MRACLGPSSSALRAAAITFSAVCALALSRCAKIAPPPQSSAAPSRPSGAVRAMPPGVDAALDRVLGGWTTGNIAFNVPTTMRLGQTYPIHLLLSPRKSVEELQQELLSATHEGILQGAQISIAPVMEARLTGQGFEITAVTPERQTVSPEANTDWQWDVTPKNGGTGVLHLTLSAILNVNNGSLPHAIQTFDREITVQVTWAQRLSGFVGTNWQWLGTVIVVPLGGWLWSRRRAAKKT